MLRFKTEEEFLKEFGPKWRKLVLCDWTTDMDPFFGKMIKKADIGRRSYRYFEMGDFFVSDEMVKRVGFVKYIFRRIFNRAEI